MKKRLTDEQILANIKKLSSELKTEVTNLRASSNIVTSSMYDSKTNKDIIVFSIDCTQGVER